MRSSFLKILAKYRRAMGCRLLINTVILSASVIEVMYAISCYIDSRSNRTRSYLHNAFARRDSLHLRRTGVTLSTPDIATVTPGHSVKRVPLRWIIDCNFINGWVWHRICSIIRKTGFTTVKSVLPP